MPGFLLCGVRVATWSPGDRSVLLQKVVFRCVNTSACPGPVISVLLFVERVSHVVIVVVILLSRDPALLFKATNCHSQASA